LLCVAVCCSVLQFVAVHCSVPLSHVIFQALQVQLLLCCRVLQRVAVCCSVLQCVTVSCSELHCIMASPAPRLPCGAVRCCALQSVAVCHDPLVSPLSGPHLVSNIHVLVSF